MISQIQLGKGIINSCINVIHSTNFTNDSYTKEKNRLYELVKSTKSEISNNNNLLKSMEGVGAKSITVVVDSKKYNIKQLQDKTTKLESELASNELAFNKFEAYFSICIDSIDFAKRFLIENLKVCWGIEKFDIFRLVNENNLFEIMYLHALIIKENDLYKYHSEYIQHIINTFIKVENAKSNYNYSIQENKIRKMYKEFIKQTIMNYDRGMKSQYSREVESIISELESYFSSRIPNNSF